MKRTRKSKFDEILKKLKSLGDPRARAGMARFGINPQNTYGVPMPTLRKMAKEIGKNHSLAEELWSSNIHEARILASMLAEPEMVTEKQIENWVKDFDSWDVCDQCCVNLFFKTQFAYQKAVEWSKPRPMLNTCCSVDTADLSGGKSLMPFTPAQRAGHSGMERGKRKEEFVKRAGFVLISVLAVHDKKTNDEEFLKFLPIIERGSTDERNFVRKAVNWALRQIGKRNINLNKMAIKTAKEIQEIDSKNAKWVASDALRELTSKKVQQRLHRHPESR